MRIDLSGRTAFVSGSTQGIGRVIAARLAAAGAATTINGRDPDRVGAVVDELRAAAPDARIDGIAADVSTAAGADAVLAAQPAVDLLVNNLGIFAPTPVLEIDDATWQRFWDVNVMSAIRLTRGYLPACATAAAGACCSWPATRRSSSPRRWSTTASRRPRCSASRAASRRRWRAPASRSTR